MTVFTDEPIDFGTYYERFFPFKEFGRWLNYGGLLASGGTAPTLQCYLYT
jgi:hypothetical protein